MDGEIQTKPTVHNYGSNSFRFYDAMVTAVVDKHGRYQNDDFLIGKHIASNIDRSQAKIVNMDVDAQMFSSIYGMNFGIVSDDKYLVSGNWTRSVVVQNWWQRTGCFKDVDNCSTRYAGTGEALGAQSTTKLTNIQWSDDLAELGASSVLHQLKELATMSELSVRISQYAFNYGRQNATLGYVVGAMGIPSEADTLNYPGQRAMFPTRKMARNLESTLCEYCIHKFSDQAEVIVNSPISMGITPFEVSSDGSEVRLDLSNSLLLDTYQNIRDIGILHLGVLLQKGDVRRISLPDGIPYRCNDRYIASSGIYIIQVSDASIRQLVKTRPLVIYDVLPMSEQQEQCILTPSHYNILLLEEKYYIRSHDYYLGRLDNNHVTSIEHDVYVTRYGEPVNGVDVIVKPTVNAEVGDSLPKPYGAVTFGNSTSTTVNGVARFKFQRDTSVHIPLMNREYGIQKCPNDNSTTITIDGQVYLFSFGIGGFNCSYCEEYNVVILAFSDIIVDSLQRDTYIRPYTWLDDVEPILSQYARITPVMKNILDMGSYVDLTKPQNINIMKKVLALDINDPSYMPTTRDLSPGKRDMIMEWLDMPLYSSCKKPLVIGSDMFLDRATLQTDAALYIYEFRCNPDKLKYSSTPQEVIPSFTDNGREKRSGQECYRLDVPDWHKDPHVEYLECDRTNIARQLQDALKLEWATVPLYLTALYSITDGCNAEIYTLLRAVVMQEMLHMALVGNMLIALGETPHIDSKEFVPSYPDYLPGCVLPGLNITLGKLSHDQIAQFMAIEIPNEVGSHTAYFTIGKFYENIRRCINSIDYNVFDSDPMGERQVQWEVSWDTFSPVGELTVIIDNDSAVRAIDTIVSQGEGTSPIDPKSVTTNTIAHYFKFEEIFCGRHIEAVDARHYSYSGHVIAFNPEGVANMRSNPKTTTVHRDTVCFTESRSFHTLYRNWDKVV